MAATLSLQAQKRALRKATSKSLQLLTPHAIEEQSQAVASRVLSLPAFQHCDTICCYLSMPTGELSTSTIISEVLDRGKTLFVPKIESSSGGKMTFLQLHGHDDLSSLPSGLWGIKEPEYTWKAQRRKNALDEDSEPLDLILMPGVAFDRSLSRLGHGKGYYDRFLSSYVSNGRKKPLLVALALRDQLLESGQVPVSNHDWKMDVIVTPDEILQ